MYNIISSLCQLCINHEYLQIQRRERRSRVPAMDRTPKGLQTDIDPGVYLSPFNHVSNHANLDLLTLSGVSEHTTHTSSELAAQILRSPMGGSQEERRYLINHSEFYCTVNFFQRRIFSHFPTLEKYCWQSTSLS